MNAQLVVGFEVHVQLETESKLFCLCPNRYGVAPNTHICPTCTGQPGALPVLNQWAVQQGLRAALALHSEVPEHLAFDRKNYFYPDLPKGYQITQQDFPLGRNGELVFEDQHGVQSTLKISRIHLEEDAGKSTLDSSRVRRTLDFNRAGVPLLEIVSTPTLHSAQDVLFALKSLRRLIRTLELSECSMEKGSLRGDINVSLRPHADAPLGTKVELKNLNSFRHIERAIDYEADRQKTLLDQGHPIVQETRRFDVDTGQTLPMRRKENADDYRYFPEPDLPILILEKDQLQTLKDQLPESPPCRHQRYTQELGLPKDHASALVDEPPLAQYFESCLVYGVSPGAAAKWILTAICEWLNESQKRLSQCPIRPQRLAELIQMVEDDEVSHQAARRVFGFMIEEGDSPRDIAASHQLFQNSDEGSLLPLIEEAVRENPKAIQEFKAGKSNALNALVGFVMRRSQGQANPQRVHQKLLEVLDSDP